MQKVIIKNLEIMGRHGVKPEEKINFQPFVISASMSTEFLEAAETDNIDKTVNYSSVCKLFDKIVKENSFNLIEKLAAECAYAVMENFTNVSEITLSVDKPQAPMKGKFESVAAELSLKREVCYLSLGSSLGDKRAAIERALSALEATRGIAVKKVSTFYKTAPYGGVAHNTFLNCAVEIETFLPAEELLRKIHIIEADGGRVRERKWDDRTIDIDIIFYGNEVINTPNLVVPHPEWEIREFVLKPLKEIAPEFVCPVKMVKLCRI